MKLLLAVVVAAALAGPSVEAARAPALTARSSSYGKLLFDGRGFVLYAFTRDRRASACYGECAKAWPPYFAPKGRLGVGHGVKRALLAR
jgi:predicted lipoprotein with Yx(FWY)xxD motif